MTKGIVDQLQLLYERVTPRHRSKPDDTKDAAEQVPLSSPPAYSPSKTPRPMDRPVMMDPKETPIAPPAGEPDLIDVTEHSRDDALDAPPSRRSDLLGDEVSMAPQSPPKPSGPRPLPKPPSQPADEHKAEHDIHMS